jgi:hypothetical protein
MRRTFDSLGKAGRRCRSGRYPNDSDVVRDGEIGRHRQRARCGAGAHDAWHFDERSGGISEAGQDWRESAMSTTLQRFYTGSAVETIGDLEFAGIAADDEIALDGHKLEMRGGLDITAFRDNPVLHAAHDPVRVSVRCCKSDFPPMATDC